MNEPLKIPPTFGSAIELFHPGQTTIHLDPRHDLVRVNDMQIALINTELDRVAATYIRVSVFSPPRIAEDLKHLYRS
jgi:hypothetical protein